MAESRRRSPTAEILFQGQSVGPDLLPSLWNDGVERKVRYTRARIARARGLRLQTQGIQLRQSWVRKHPEAAEWVVKYLPERRTLERDLIASAGSIEPYYDRVAIGKQRDMDYDNAEACASYMETWRKSDMGPPFGTFIEKGVEDGPYGLTILPSDADIGGCPDEYDRLDEAAYALLEEEKREGYERDEDDPKRRYVKRNADGSMRKNPRFDRDKAGKPRGDRKDFERDDEKSREAHRDAIQRHLLQQEQGPFSIRVISANDCIPYLTKGTGRERWKLRALLERTLYYPEDLPGKFGWVGMGDRLLTPQGFQEGRETGQNGMFYVYALYMTWIDPKDPRKIERPIICYSVGGVPTWMDGAEMEEDTLPDNGVAVLDLYQSHGLTGPYWWYGGGSHTSDDDPDFYWEPYITPLVGTITSLEGLSTMANAATATNATPGYWYKPDPALVALDDEAMSETHADGSSSLKIPDFPDSGEVQTIVGDVMPATPAQVSPDLWRVIQLETLSLQQNTLLEQPGAQNASGRQMVVKETIAMTSKRHNREAALAATRFCGERALMILDAIAREFDVRWPLQTTKEQPVGQQMREAQDILEFDPAWVENGEYKLTCTYPSEPDPVRVEQEMAAIAAGLGSFEAYCEARGITDVESEWAKVLKTQLRMMQEYRLAQLTRLAKRQGNTLMIEVLNLQKQQRMTKTGMPGFDEGMPMAALNGPGGGQPTGLGGPTTAQRSIGGMMAGAVGPQKQDAMLTAQIPGAA